MRRLDDTSTAFCSPDARRGSCRLLEKRSARAENKGKQEHSRRSSSKESSPPLLLLLSSPPPSSSADHRAIGFALPLSPANRTLLFPNATSTPRRDVHVFHRELLSLLHGLWLRARERRERERERSESNLERGRRERVLRRVIFEEVRQNSFFRRQRKGGGAEIKKTPSEIPSLFSLPLSSSQLASFFPLLPPALCSPPEDAGSLSSSRTNWNESRNCCSSSSSHGRAATTAGRRKKRLAASRSGGVEASSLRLRNPWALPP